jgi:hypothetical protein
MNLVDEKNTVISSTSSIIDKGTDQFHLVHTWQLTEKLLNKGRFEIQISENVKSKICFLSSIGIKRDIIEGSDYFEKCYNPFYEECENIELFLLPSSLYSNCQSFLKFNLSLSSFSMEFEQFYFNLKNEKVSLKILEKIHKQTSKILKGNLDELELETLSRLKNSKNFMKCLQNHPFSDHETISKYIHEILNHLNQIKKNETTYKYEIVLNQELIEKNKEEMKREETNDIEDLKELEMYEKSGFDKTAISKLEYTLNMIRILLSHKNNHQAKIFCDKHCDSTVKIEINDYDSRFHKAIEFYNSIIDVREKDKLIK